MPSVLEEINNGSSGCGTAADGPDALHPAFTPLVDPAGIQIVPPSPAAKPLKNINEVRPLIVQGRKQEVKQLLRTNAWPANHPIRRQLWPMLCMQHHGNGGGKTDTMDNFYWDMVNQVFGTTDLPDKSISLPPFVEPSHCQSYYMTHKGRSITDRVVSVLGYACPDIVYSPTIYPICALLLHYVSEEECYHCMASLVASKEKTFITQTKLLYEVTWKTVMQICKKHVKSAAVHLARHCSNNRSERIYMDWIWWIFQGLPFHHLVRIMDCFFHEGIKVLYRTAMAILILFQKFTTSSSEWLAEIQKNGVDSALTKFCKELPVTPQKLLKVAFGIRGLSSTYISRVFLKTEMILRSKSAVNGSKQMVRSRSSENLPNSQSQNNIQMVSHTLTIREKMSEEMYNDMTPSYLNLAKWFPFPNPTFGDEELHSRLRNRLLTLWSWLPVRITMYQPILLYTTEEHGCSLTTFYVRVEQHEPTLLMIKTCNNEVFGAYCSSKWGERNIKDDRGNRQAYFGTGETFLFSLYPERAKYPWVGMDGDKVHHAAELFMAADTKMITIGGGEGQAIWMDENVRYGKTDKCATFNNPPLCPGRDFEIRVLEVYGFATDH
ncbi:unnamed protein product [Acanthoscelides obtectus]|uniref:TLDc domain-containing protein n=1 Tax=Acanthoscelides obtectus TaxID=200917 RepID=A0A9P0NU33_ACAOB|nr:unnamed protein product [Acanthoscelides obtectus]CAK1665676.1 TBC1 domain family member 24 [Acanthoscelides obtectus]